MRIFAMGGGGFSAPPDNGSLDDYVLALTGKQQPRICLLPTAGGDADAQIHRFHAAFRSRTCEPTHVSLFRLGRTPVPLADHLLAQDVIYVGGGSMLNLLAIWRAHGLDEIMRAAWETGVVLCGLSAGSMCWFEAGITTSSGAPAPAEGLGFLPGSNSVHYDAEPARRPAYLDAIRAGMPDGYGVDDGAGLLFEGERLGAVVSSRPGARAYRVSAESGTVTETPLPAIDLTSGAAGPKPVPAEITEMRLARQARLQASPLRRGRLGN